MMTDKKKSVSGLEKLADDFVSDFQTNNKIFKSAIINYVHIKSEIVSELKKFYIKFDEKEYKAIDNEDERYEYFIDLIYYITYQFYPFNENVSDTISDKLLPYLYDVLYMSIQKKLTEYTNALVVKK